MSTKTLAMADPEGAPRAQVTPGFHPIVPGIASGLLLWLSFPPAGWGWLAWIALMPLFLLIRTDKPRWAVYLGAWAGGEVFWLLSIQWVRLSDPGTAWLAWLVMATCLSAWWPAFLFLARLAVRRLKLPMMLAAPVAWVAFEFIRAFVISGFPWYYLAHSQYLYLHLIQIADVAGALGLSFLVAMANACWVDLLTRPLFRPSPKGPRLARPQIVRLATLAVGVIVTVGYGTYRLKTAAFRPGPRLALLQSNIKQEYKNHPDEERIVATYQGLIASALRQTERPDLIVWPETAYPHGFVVLDPKLELSAFNRQVKSLSARATVEYWRDMRLAGATRQLHGLTDQADVPMLVGTIVYDFNRSGLSRFNSAVLFEPGKTTIQSYNKLHLVPFGEYVPLIKTFPWLVILTPYRGSDHIPGLTFGGEPHWFELKGYRFATPICFEDTVPHVVRRFFAEVKDGHQPDLLINISNDGWFQWSEELEMHLAVSVFRAVENRVPLARAVNTGISAIIDGNGQIQAQMAKNTEGVLAGIAQLDDRVSLYTTWGDWLGQACLAISLGLLPLGLAHLVYNRRRMSQKTRAA
ncbi:MAG TPA: apolipoprotein N-acyltransferase [Isosphaeraceae bacterium]|jgi:apolipoprotein N-acyltransferase|nr:apolipoprotein N-acyltransferase [Isosphaeraceae bacterium]